MIYKIIDRLEIADWPGAKENARDHYVVTVAFDSPFIGDEHFKLIDGPGNDGMVFNDAVRAVVSAHRIGKNVIVHCVGGRSRSAAVATSAISDLTGMDICDAYDLVIVKNPMARIHPYLSKFLL